MKAFSFSVIIKILAGSGRNERRIGYDGEAKESDPEPVVYEAAHACMVAFHGNSLALTL